MKLFVPYSTNRSFLNIVSLRYQKPSTVTVTFIVPIVPTNALFMFEVNHKVELLVKFTRNLLQNINFKKIFKPEI